MQHHLQMARNLPEVRGEQNQPGEQGQESGRVVVQQRTHGVTDDQIKAMASWDSKAGNYQELKGNQMVEVTVVR